MNRREFGWRAGSVATGLAWSSQELAAQKPASSNDRIQMGFIGVGA